MAASKPVVLPGDDIMKEVECRVRLEQKQLRIITCGHKLCQDCIGKIATPCYNSIIKEYNTSYTLWYYYVWNDITILSLNAKIGGGFLYFIQKP